jgi:NADP-dependent 3-hydroxy acid dehydrogenase YdfG
VANGLDGKVAIVTGASSGIGEATSEALAAEGATVVAAARREERLSDLKGRVEDNGGRLEVVQADVTDEVQAHDLVQRAEAEFGGVDILVNNAGVMLLSREAEGTRKEDWDLFPSAPSTRWRASGC